MKTTFPIGTFLIGLAMLAVCIATPSPCRAGEESADFLAALRERGYYDVALDYLEKMATSPLAAADFKELILYEKGVTMIAASRSRSDFGIREGQLDEAQRLINQFIKQNASHPYVSAARGELGNLLVERARIKIERGKKDEKLRARYQKEARALYDQAYKALTVTQNELRQRLTKIPKVLDTRDPQQVRLIEVRDRLRADYLQAQLRGAAILEESADTAQAGSKPYNDLLTKAANEFNAIYEKYRTRLAGLYARLYQGRCHAKMNKCKEALSYFADLLEQPDQPEAFRILKLKTLLLAADCWLDNSQQKYTVAIAAIEPVIESARANEAKQADFLSLRLSLARAHRRMSDRLTKSKPNDPQIARGYAEAKKLTLYVSRVPGKFQRPARQLLSELPGGAALANAKIVPKSFAEAKAAGKESLDTVQVATETVAKLSARLRTEKNAKVKSDLKKQRDKALQLIVTSRSDAIDYFRRALELADDDTPIEDANVVQYFLCYLYYAQNDFYESAILGELLARRYPDSSAARQGAKIALACYVQLYQQNRHADKGFETQRIYGAADYIAQSWPGQTEAIEAINTLIPFLIKDKKLDQALQYLRKIPASSSHRGQAELKTGQALWSSYLVGMQRIRDWQRDGAPAGTDVAAEKARLERIKQQSQKTLADGVARMQKAGGVDSTIATAVLSLAQIYVDTDQPQKAIVLLENSKIGALTLVRKKHPATARKGFAEETYKTALRAYISSLATAKDSDAIIKKAQDIMSDLKAVVGDTAEGQAKLVAIYFSLARDLEEQVKLASPQTKPALLRGFETFLTQVGAEATELNVLNWVAETFFGMGESVDTGRGNPPADAQRFYDEAINTYQAILKQGEVNPEFLQPNMRLQVQMRLATAKRRLGRYKEAIDDFEEILIENNMMLNVQIEAAATYQEWAKSGKSTLYSRAMTGGREDKRKTIDGKPNRSYGRYIIWGWGKLSQMTASQQQFRDAFHRARYNLALCRFDFALREGKETSRDSKDKYLKMAQRDIRLTKQLFPAMGGEDWEPKYDRLFKRIQKELGEKQLGLAAIETAARG